jgi:hypothetical protein
MEEGVFSHRFFGSSEESVALSARASPREFEYQLQISKQQLSSRAADLFRALIRSL